MKRQVAATIAALLALGSAGCPSNPAPSSTQPARKVDAGAILHKPSGISFPSHVGDFVRGGDLREYKADGSDVSAAYNNLAVEGPVVATTYVYLSPKLTSIASPQAVIDSARAKFGKAEYEACKAEIVNAHPQPVLISEKMLTSPEHTPVLMAEYEYTEEFAGSTQRVRSRLYLQSYVNGAWNLKHRITFPAGKAFQSSVDAYVTQFLAAQ